MAPRIIDVEPPASLDSGVEGNARLTATAGVLLVGLLIVEGVTILRVRDLITLHIFLGIVLLGPVLLKTASTMYRVVRYYTGHGPYVRRGAPPTVLRLLGPFVVLLSLAVIGTGIGLLAYQPGQGDSLLLKAHKATFILWFGAMAIHVLGHAREAAVTSWREMRPLPGDRASRRRTVRFALIAVSLIVGIGAAAATMPAAKSWTGNRAILQQQDH